MCTRPERRRPTRHRQAGVTLVELIVALTLAGVILSSIWNAWTLLGRTSTDPLVARQSLAIAQAALAPADGSWFYCVLADADGRHAFTDSADEFEILVAEAEEKGLLG